MKILEQLDAGKNEQRAHHKRSDHTVEQDLMLRLLGNLECPKDQHEHENVVDAERFLNQVSREECHSCLRSPSEVNINGEQQGKADPCCAFNERSAQRDFLRFAMEDP